MLVYDIEIVNAVPPPEGEEKLPGIKYCEGWEDHANMGVSVIGAYDYETDRYRIFLQDNFEAFADLVSKRYVIGFNSLKFDDRVVKESLGIDVKTDYDILDKIWAALGGYKKGNKLDDLTKANGISNGKVGRGDLAPINWQRGNYGVVIDYCLDDVKLTKALVDIIIEKQRIENGAGDQIIMPMINPYESNN